MPALEIADVIESGRRRNTIGAVARQCCAAIWVRARKARRMTVSARP